MVDRLAMAQGASLHQQKLDSRWCQVLNSHRQRHFKISNDPFFVEKVRDIVGLYMNLSDHDVVLCVDEKTKR